MTAGRSFIMYSKGDIVLVPFPFSDLSSSKTRPAVVVSTEDYEGETGNIIVAMITSVLHASPFDCEIKEWKAANLLSPSWVRVKLATLEPSLVRFRPGKLTAEDLSEVNKILYLALEL
jgi:mRNA interferase MazF